MPKKGKKKDGSKRKDSNSAAQAQKKATKKHSKKINGKLKRKTRPSISQTSPDRNIRKRDHESIKDSAYKVDSSLLDEGKAAAQLLGSTSKEAVTAGYAFLDDFLQTNRESSDSAMDVEALSIALEKFAKTLGTSSEIGGDWVGKVVKVWLKLLLGGYSPMAAWFGGMPQFPQTGVTPDAWKSVYSNLLHSVPQSYFGSGVDGEPSIAKANSIGNSTANPEIGARGNLMPNPALPVQNAAAYLGGSVDFSPYDPDDSQQNQTQRAGTARHEAPIFVIECEQPAACKTHWVQFGSYPQEALAFSMPLSTMGEPCTSLHEACVLSFDRAGNRHELVIKETNRVPDGHYRFNLVDRVGAALALVSVMVRG